MPDFIDTYMPDSIPGYPCVAAPRFSTAIAVTAGGLENRNQNWEHPLHRYVLSEAEGREWDAIEDLKRLWMVARGPFFSFAWRDPYDKASIDLLYPNEPDDSVLARISGMDVQIGVGTGFTTGFPLVKPYVIDLNSYSRSINLPVLDSVKVTLDGVLVDPSEYSVSRPGGEVTFNLPPDDGAIVRAGFLFDVQVRFESDDAFEGIVRTYQVGGFAEITLIEVRPC